MRAIDADKLVWRKTCHGSDCLYPEDIENAETIFKWIPVSEELPDYNVEVLVTTAWNSITIAEKCKNGFWFICEGAVNAEDEDILAWMPLPEVYKSNKL